MKKNCRSKYQDYYSLVRYLKKEVPIPFYVRRVKMPDGELGDCEKFRNKFRIRVDKELDETLAMNITLHETAHIFTWSNKDNVAHCDHGPSWGRAYAKTYRIFLKWLEESEKNEN